MIRNAALSFSATVRPFFPSLWWEMGHSHACAFLECLVARKSCMAKTAKHKPKNTPAHQGKFHLAPSSPCASAFTAHTVKGRCALRSALLHYALDLLARLRPSLLTTAAPREIFPQGRRSSKAANATPAFSPCPSSLSPLVHPPFSGSRLWLVSGGPVSCWANIICLPSVRVMFSGSSFSLASGGAVSCRVSIVRFPLVRKVLSGCGVFAFLMRCIRLPHVGLFVRHHPGGPGYVSYRRSASYFTPGRWLRPLDPRRKTQMREKP